jgi:hypothetical protein
MTHTSSHLQMSHSKVVLEGLFHPFFIDFTCMYDGVVVELLDFFFFFFFFSLPLIKI